MNVSCESDLFKHLSSDTDKIVLTDDIYITEDSSPIKNFSGVLDGKGHTIYDLDFVLVKKLNEGSLIQNISFKNLRFTHEEASSELVKKTVTSGIFHENCGQLYSISVEDVNGPNMGKPQESAGVIVQRNVGHIEDCHVSDVDINTNSNLGGICGANKGTIKDCTGTSLYIIGQAHVGGICSKNESGSVKNCTVEDSEFIGENSIGGLVGMGFEEHNVKNCTVTDSYIETEFMDTGGLIGRDLGDKSKLSNCSVKNSELIGNRTVNLLGDGVEGTLSTSCSVQNCFVKTTNPNVNDGTYLFTRKVQNCFITNTVIEGTVILDNIDEISNSYVDIELRTESPPVLGTVESKSFYMDLLQKDISRKSKHIEVIDVDDLADIEKHDTVELCADIDMSNGDFTKIEEFDGVFDGNEHTISNISEPLFNHCTGTVKNVYVDEFCIPKYSRTGCIAKYGSGCTFENIHITKTNTISVETDTYGLICDIDNGSIKHCSAVIKTNMSTLSGLARQSANTLIEDCSAELDVTISNTGTGIVEGAPNSKLKRITSRGTVVLTNEESRFNGISGAVKTAKSCRSSITITAKNYVSKVQHASGLFKSVKEKAQNCTYEGTINLKNQNVSYGIGGIIALSGSKVYNCVNKGDIINHGENPIGGISSVNEGKIVKCVNEGVISGGETAGGITGRVIRSGKILKSINTGTVQQATNCGGLTGTLGSNVQIKNSYNHAKIDSSDVLIGHAGQDQKNNDLSNLFYIPIDETQSSNYGKETSMEPEKLNIILF